MPRSSPLIRTLRKRDDFLRLNRGRKLVNTYFILRYLPAPPAQAEMRVGLTVTTKCGNAVVRNRIKRRLRALVRDVMPDLAHPPMDYVLIARAEHAQQLCTDAFEDVRAAFIATLAKVTP